MLYLHWSFSLLTCCGRLIFINGLQLSRIFYGLQTRWLVEINPGDCSRAASEISALFCLNSQIHFLFGRTFLLTGCRFSAVKGQQPSHLQQGTPSLTPAESSFCLKYRPRLLFPAAEGSEFKRQTWLLLGREESFSPTPSLPLLTPLAPTPLSPINAMSSIFRSGRCCYQARRPTASYCSLSADTCLPPLLPPPTLFPHLHQ